MDAVPHVAHAMTDPKPSTQPPPSTSRRYKWMIAVFGLALALIGYAELEFAAWKVNMDYLEGYQKDAIYLPSEAYNDERVRQQAAGLLIRGVSSASLGVALLIVGFRLRTRAQGIRREPEPA